MTHSLCFAAALAIALLSPARAEAGDGTRRALDPHLTQAPREIQARVAPTVPAGDLGRWRDFLPPARRGAGAIFDPLRDRMILFGGSDQDVRDETWSFDARTAGWSQLTLLGRLPVPRSMVAPVHDPTRDRMWMFGGLARTGVQSGLWGLDLAEPYEWIQLQPPGTWPDPRGAGALVFDRGRDRLILFGGQISTTAAGSRATGDVWVISPSADTLKWTRLSPGGKAPPARWGSIVMFDEPRDRMVVLGGRNRDSVFTDAWELRFTPLLSWAEIRSSGPHPPARDGALGALDLNGDRIVTVGGVDPSTGEACREVWALPLDDPEHWDRLIVAGAGPADLAEAGVAFDDARRRLVIHGGHHAGPPGYVLSETWGLDLAGAPAWHRLAPAFASPSPRYGQATAFDPIGDHFWIFGGATAGEAGATCSNEFWRADVLEPERWTPIETTGPAPPARQEAVGAYDPIARRVTIFGGWSDDGTLNPRYFDDTWSASVDAPSTWTRLPGPTEGALAPAARRGHAGVYDPLRRSLLVFGGVGHDSAFGDVWELALAGNGGWRRLIPRGTGPGTRYFANMIYDAAHDRVVLYGGSIDKRSQDDLWALTLGDDPRWSRLEPEGLGPGPRSRHAMVYDEKRQRALLSGGFALDDDVIYSMTGMWALALDGAPSWSYVPMIGPEPPPATSPSAVYDARRDRVIRFGGGQIFGDILGDFRALEFAPGAPPRSIWLAGAQVASGGVRLLWQTDAVPGASASIQKRIDVPGEGLDLRMRSVGDWFDLADVAVHPGGSVGYTDPAVRKGASYRYRVVVAGAPGGEARVDIPGTPGFAIESVSPQPSLGILSIAFRSTGLAQARLDLFDVGGRRVATRDLGTLPEGSHQVSWNLSPGHRSGVYFLELTQGSRREARKVVVAR